MSRKMQLPDAMLDMVSGGTAYLGGDTVTAIDMNGDGLQVTTSKGVFQMNWNASEKAEFASNPSELLEDLKTARGMMQNPGDLPEFDASLFKKM